MVSYSGGGGGLPPDVTGNGDTPGGLKIGGDLDVGTPNDHVHESVILLNGAVFLSDTPALIEQADDLLFVNQSSPVTLSGGGAYAFRIVRSGDISASDYFRPAFQIEDTSSSAQPLLRIKKTGVTVVQVNIEGGLGVFGHAPPTAPRTLAQATVTAITDANAKTAVQACADALSDMGALTLT